MVKQLLFSLALLIFLEITIFVSSYSVLLKLFYSSIFIDINKFLWMVRIGGSTPEGSHIHESDYFTKSGEFRVDKEGSPTMLNCLMYKLCYYRFGGLYTQQVSFSKEFFYCLLIYFVEGRATGFDRVRHAEIGNKDFELDYLDEAFTSEHWIVRIYKVIIHHPLAGRFSFSDIF